MPIHGIVIQRSSVDFNGKPILPTGFHLLKGKKLDKVGRWNNITRHKNERDDTYRERVKRKIQEQYF